MKLYKRPNLKTYSCRDLAEAAGPMQTASVDLTFQQVAKLDINKNYQSVMFTDLEAPKLYKQNNQTKVG